MTEILAADVYMLPFAECPHCSADLEINVCEKCGGWCQCNQRCDGCDNEVRLDWSEA